MTTSNKSFQVYSEQLLPLYCVCALVSSSLYQTYFGIEWLPMGYDIVLLMLEKFGMKSRHIPKLRYKLQLQNVRHVAPTLENQLSASIYRQVAIYLSISMLLRLHSRSRSLHFIYFSLHEESSTSWHALH